MIAQCIMTCPDKTDPVRMLGFGRVQLEMRRVRHEEIEFTEQQIAFALRQAETGTKVKEITRMSDFC